MRLEIAQLRHIDPFAKTMTLQEKKNDSKHTGRWITTLLSILIASPYDTFVLLDDNNIPDAFFGMGSSERLWLSLHPRFYGAGHDYVGTVRPAYTSWQDRYELLTAYVRRRDANAVRWYDEVGFVEPPTAIFCDDYYTGDLIRVPGPLVGAP